MQYIFCLPRFCWMTPIFTLGLFMCTSHQTGDVMSACRAQAYVGAFMWQPSDDSEGMSSAESAASDSAMADLESASSHSDSSTSSPVPSTDTEAASDSSSSASSSSEASSSSSDGTANSPSGRSTAESDFGGLTSDQQLCEVGTFAQVHTIVPIDPRRAQLLLLGHRRLRRTRQVRVPCQTLTSSAVAPDSIRVDRLPQNPCAKLIVLPLCRRS